MKVVGTLRVPSTAVYRNFAREDPVGEDATVQICVGVGAPNPLARRMGLPCAPKACRSIFHNRRSAVCFSLQRSGMSIDGEGAERCAPEEHHVFIV